MTDGDTSQVNYINDINRWLKPVAKALLVLLFICDFPGLHAQNQELSFYFKCIEKLGVLDKPSDSLHFDSLLNYCLDKKGVNGRLADSLKAEMLTMDFTLKKQYLPPDQRRLLLHRHIQRISQMPSIPLHPLVKLYGALVREHWLDFNADSLDKYLQLLEIRLFKIQKPVPEKLEWYYYKSWQAYSQNDFEASLTYSQNALNYLNAYFPERLNAKYHFLNAVGIGYRRTEQVEKAIDHYQNALAGMEDEFPESQLKGTIYNNLGLSFMGTEQYDKAISYIKKANRYYIQNHGKGYYEIGTGFDNISICFRYAGQLDSALFYSKKSVEFIEDFMGDQHPDLLVPIESITKIHRQAGELGEALKVNQRARSLIEANGWSRNSPSGNYLLQDIFPVMEYGIYLNRVVYDSTGNQSYLLRSLEAGDDFMATVDYAYDQFKNSLSKEIFQRKYEYLYSILIDNLHILYQSTGADSLLEKGFDLTEKFKSLELLYAALKARVDESELYRVLNAEHKRHADSISVYENELHRKMESNDSALVLKARIASLKEKYYRWQEKIREEQPKYYSLVHHPENLSVREVQGEIDQNESLISYHVSQEAVYIFLINPDSLYWQKVELNSHLPKLVADLRNSITSYHTGSERGDSAYLESASLFTGTSYKLYNMLLEPLADKYNERLTIVGDKVLGYLPFDLLLTELPDRPYHFRDHPYLIWKHTTNYSFSVYLWREMRSFERTYRQSRLLAFAPSFSVGKIAASSPMQDDSLRSDLAALQFNELEARQVSSILHGALYLGIEATKSAFLKNCSDYELLHLATHSKANDETGDYSYLAFSSANSNDFKLYAKEIYGLDLHAKLVTLSSCETGLGELRSGEGIISLARAFSFAGAECILSSLWAVNDKSTSELMGHFYENLDKGLSVDQALRQAKLDFVKMRGHADAHPFYWGGFVPVGDMSPLSQNGKRSRLPLLLAAFLFLVLATLIFRAVK